MKLLALPDVTRIQVISPDGKAYSAHSQRGVSIHLQDEGQALKLFPGEQLPASPGLVRAVVAEVLREARAIPSNPEFTGSLEDAIVARLSRAGIRIEGTL